MAATKKKAAGKKAAAKKGGASKGAGAGRGGAGKSAAKKGGAGKSAGGGGAATKAGGAKGAAKKSGGGAAKRAPNPAFMKPMRPSPQLAAIIGNEAMPRTAITSRVWEYVKKNKLQDQNNKRAINADDKLRPIFGKNQVTMFEMTSLVNKHLSE